MIKATSLVACPDWGLFQLYGLEVEKQYHFQESAGSHVILAPTCSPEAPGSSR
jgi:hypothetical protein